jgi:hypothetical protein
LFASIASDFIYNLGVSMGLFDVVFEKEHFPYLLELCSFERNSEFNVESFVD